MLCLKIAGWVANSVDPDETPRSAASHLGLYCLLRPVCPNTYGKYGTYDIVPHWKRVYFIIIWIKQVKLRKKIVIWFYKCDRITNISALNLYYFMANSADDKLCSFSYFSQKIQALTFHSSYLFRRQFEWNVKAFFLWVGGEGGGGRRGSGVDIFIYLFF